MTLVQWPLQHKPDSHFEYVIPNTHLALGSVHHQKYRHTLPFHNLTGWLAQSSHPGTAQLDEDASTCFAGSPVVRDAGLFSHKKRASNEALFVSTHLTLLDYFPW